MIETILRPFQEQSLRILSGSSSAHVICTAPTGAGKSLIFETLARREGARTLIISPLRALIRQQEDRLKNLGVQITPRFKNSSRSYASAQAWITTPEALAECFRRGFHPEANILWVADEAHCVEEWGETFRPEFALLPQWVNQWGFHKSLWLSATLSPGARDRLRSQLPDPQYWVGEFGLHPKLRLQKFLVPRSGRVAFLEHWLNLQPGPGIIFCSTRRSAEELGRWFQLFSRNHSRSERSAVYHAGLTREERLSVEQLATQGRLHWLSTTSAFGMGMNHPYFQWVLIWEPPHSLSDLAQMLGRCGRSAEARPRAALLWEEAELERLQSTSPRDSEKISDFFRSTEEPQVWLKEFFS